jgi:hypothetical protein
MEPQRKIDFEPYIESVGHIVDAMKRKERIIEGLNTGDYSDASRVIRENVLVFESLFSSLKDPDTMSQNKTLLSDSQKKILEKVIEDSNLGIESHDLKVIRNSIRDLESFRLQIIDS